MRASLACRGLVYESASAWADSCALRANSRVLNATCEYSTRSSRHAVHPEFKTPRSASPLSRTVNIRETWGNRKALQYGSEQPKRRPPVPSKPGLDTNKWDGLWTAVVQQTTVWPKFRTPISNQLPRRDKIVAPRIIQGLEKVRLIVHGCAARNSIW